MQKQMQSFQRVIPWPDGAVKWACMVADNVLMSLIRLLINAVACLQARITLVIQCFKIFFTGPKQPSFRFTIIFDLPGTYRMTGKPV